MNEANFKELLVKYQQGQCTAAEKAQLESWVTFGRFDGPVLSDEMLNERLLKLEARLPLANAAVKIKLWPRIVGVAAAVAAIAFGIWFYTARHPEPSEATRDLLSYANDIAPGGSRATLTANGKTITLSEAKTGVTINAKALTYNDGTNVYPGGAPEMTGKGWDDGAVMVTAATPKGGTYAVVLQDGTKVWLNADSKLEFLSNYRNKAQRIVKLTGEAYFEVAKVLSNKERIPFIVQTRNQQVEVLGTHFNINAYPQEIGIKTTLVEGSVKVRALPPARIANPKDKKWQNAVKVEIILKPGEQALLKGLAQLSSYKVDARDAIAWKEGFFSFKNSDIQTVMQQMARWYDVDVEYEGQIPEKVLTGKMYRNVNASQVLKLLDFYQIKYRITNKKIIISN